MTESAGLAIIGGGAAGLAAAIFAAQAVPARRVVLLDGAARLGAKILISGGGRCNVTHDVVTAADFHGSRPVVRNILAAFDVPATVRWFASLGVELKREETGKLFPVTDSAHTVLSALLGRCDDLSVILRTAARVTRIAPPADPHRAFTIDHAAGTIRAPRVILATGGRSLPKSGSDGSGWDLARALGHTVTATHAALVPLVLDARCFHAQLSGISHDVELTTTVEGKPIDRRRGSLLWTHFGVSGPAVMDASRFWTIAHDQGQSPQLRCNLIPPDEFPAADRWLIAEAAARPRTSILTLVADRLPQRVAAAVLAHVEVDPSSPLNQLSRDARRALVHALTALPLPVLGHRGWNYAEVTAGGVALAEIDHRTMASRKVPGLYLIGEMLDCDGRIGGFNFQWAWSTAHLAARATAS